MEPLAELEHFVLTDYPFVCAALATFTGSVDDAEDAVAEAVARIVAASISPDSWRAWIYVQAKRLCISNARRSAVARRHQHEMFPSLISVRFGNILSAIRRTQWAG